MATTPRSDDEREALIDRMRRASTAIYVATDAAVADDLSAILQQAARLLAREHPEPDAPAQVGLSVQSRRSGKTQRMIDALLAQANERGIAVEIIESKHPEPEITDDVVEPLHGEREPIARNQVLRGVDLALDRLVRADAFTERTLRILDELRAEVLGVVTPNEVRSHYRVPVGEGEQRGDVSR